MGIGSHNKAKHNGRYNFDRNKVDGGKSGDNGDNKVGKKYQKTSQSKNLSKSKKTVGSSDFFILGTRLAFTELK